MRKFSWIDLLAPTAVSLRRRLLFRQPGIAAYAARATALAVVQRILPLGRPLAGVLGALGFARRGHGHRIGAAAAALLRSRRFGIAGLGRPVDAGTVLGQSPCLHNWIGR